MLDPLAVYESGPFGGPFAISSILADGLVTADLPYEGVWVPVKWAEEATVELSTTGSPGTIQVDIWGTNQQNPTNTYTVTVGGSVSPGDVLNLTFASRNLPSAGIEVSYTADSSDTTSTIATALAAAINANTMLQGLGIIAKAAAAVVTVNWPSVAPNLAPTAGNTPSSPPAPQNTLYITPSKSSGASETLTLACGADGTNLTPSHLSAAGLTALTPMPVRFVKARVTELSGSGTLSLALAGTT